MFSLQVIIAVEILTHLNYVPENDPFWEKRGLGRDIREIACENFVQKSTKRKVVSILLRSGYIVVAGSACRFLRLQELSHITLYDMVCLFHGGVILGESYDHRRSIGSAHFITDSYLNLCRFETPLQQQMQQVLQQTTLADLTGAKPCCGTES